MFLEMSQTVEHLFLTKKNNMKLQLSYPTNTYMVSQGFGANPAMYAQPKYGGIKVTTV